MFQQEFHLRHCSICQRIQFSHQQSKTLSKGREKYSMHNCTWIPVPQAHQLEPSPCKQTQIQRPILCRACFEIHNLVCVYIQSKSCEDRLAKGITCFTHRNREIENWNESSPDIADISNPKSKRSVAWSMPNW
jgi:hypothetical protein